MDDHQLCVGTGNKHRSDLAGGLPPHRASEPIVRLFTYYFLLGRYDIGCRVRLHRE